MNDAATLLDVAVRAAATDIVLTPGTAVGNLHLRAGFRAVHSEPLMHSTLNALAQQLSRKAGMPDEAPLLQLQVGSFDHDGTRVRVTRMLTAGGPVVRLRLQLPGLLDQALAEFRKGDYGGQEALPFLELQTGLLVVTGPPASGKTSALSHLVAHVRGKTLIVSEARELDLQFEVLHPARRSALELAEDLTRLDPPVVALDELDEELKLELGRELAGARLVLMSLTAPDLASAIRRLRAGGIEPDLLAGVFRVTWREEDEEVRRPEYRWYPVGRHEPGLCAVCGAARGAEGPCPSCGIPPLREVLDRVILERMNSPEGYRALDRLEQEWGAVS